MTLKAYRVTVCNPKSRSNDALLCSDLRNAIAVTDQSFYSIQDGRPLPPSDQRRFFFLHTRFSFSWNPDAVPGLAVITRLQAVTILLEKQDADSQS